MMKVYAAYKGDEYIMQGDVHELSEKLGVSLQTVMFRKSPCYKKRMKKDGNAMMLYQVDDVDEPEHIERKPVRHAKHKPQIKLPAPTVQQTDIVSRPQHYNYGDIEVIDFIEQVVSTYDSINGYRVGSVLKYIARAPLKNGLEDLKKAEWFLSRTIKNMEE